MAVYINKHLGENEMPKAKSKSKPKAKQNEFSIYINANGEYLFLERKDGDITILYQNKKRANFDKISKARQVPRDKGMTKIQSWKDDTSRRKKTKYKKSPNIMTRIFMMENGRCVIIKLDRKLIRFTLLPSKYYQNIEAQPLLHFDKIATSNKEAIKIFHYIKNKLEGLGLKIIKPDYVS